MELTSSEKVEILMYRIRKLEITMKQTRFLADILPDIKKVDEAWKELKEVLMTRKEL